MSYVIMHNEGVLQGLGGRVINNVDYLVYDSNDNTVEVVRGEDIQLLADNNRHFLNYRYNTLCHMTNVTIMTKSFALSLRDEVLLVAMNGFVYRVEGVRQIKDIIHRSNHGLSIALTSPNFDGGVLIIHNDEVYCSNINFTSSCLGRYSGGNAGAELVRMIV